MSPEDKEVQKKDDAQWVLSTEQGRRFIWELLGVCGVYRSLEGDPNAMLVQEGSRRIGLHLLGITTDADEDMVFAMMLEAKNRKIEEIAYVSRTDDRTDNARITSSSRDESDYDNATSGYDSGEFLPEFDDIGSFL